MKIKSIQFNGVKDSTGNHRLADVNVFTGPNASGKTAIADAIAFALTGGHPRLGARGVSALADADAMTSTVQFSDGSQSLASAKQARGSWKYEHTASPTVPVPPVLLDASVYFGLTAQQRLSFVFRLLPAESIGLSVPGLIGELNRIAEDTEDAALAHVAVQHSIVAAFAGTPSVADAMEAAVAAVKAMKKDADAVTKRMTASIMALAQQQAGDGIAVASNVDGALATVNATVARLAGELNSAHEQVQRRENGLAAIAKLDATLATLPVGELEVTESAALVTELRRQLAEKPAGRLATARAELAVAEGRLRESVSAKLMFDGIINGLESMMATNADLTAKLATVAADIASQTATVERLRAEHSQAIAGMTGANTNCRRAEDEHRAAVQSLQTAGAALRAAQMAVNELAEHAACPVCEASSDGWRVKVMAKLLATEDAARAAAEEANSKEISTALVMQTARTERDTWKAKAEATWKALSNGESTLRNHQNDHRALTERLVTLPATATDDIARMRTESAELTAQRSGLEESVTKCSAAVAEAALEEKQLSVLRTSVMSAEKALEHVRHQVAEWKRLATQRETLASNLPECATAKADSLANELATAQKAQQDLLTQQKLAAAAAQDTRRRQQAQADADGAASVSWWLKEALGLLAAIQERAIATAFTALLTNAAKITHNILGTPLVYRDGEIGRVSPTGTFVSHLTFSGMEQRLAYAALQVALAGASPLRLVVIDELSVLDDKNKAALIERMLELTADGTVTQFIGFDCRAAGYEKFVARGLNLVAM